MKSNVCVYFCFLLSLYFLVYDGISEDFLDMRYRKLELITSEEAPYAVLVFTEGNKYYCSGTLLTLEWIISAAHCMFSLDGTLSEKDNSVLVVSEMDYVPHAGDKNVQTAPHRSRGWNDLKIRRSSKIVIHSNYSFTKSFLNDIVLIKVNQAFEESFLTKPASLMVDPPEKFPISCFSPNYGKILHFRNSHHDGCIKNEKYNVSKNFKCLNLENVQENLNRLYCSVSSEFVGLCEGDNGAPLMCDGKLHGLSTNVFYFKNINNCETWPKGGEWVRRNGCGDPNNMNLFTDLCQHSEWIHKYVSSYPVIDSKNCTNY